MNKSYSKLRHIQNANLILESRFVTEQQTAQTQDQVSQVPYELPQNQRQLKKNIRQATRDENKANREFEREREQAKRTAKSNYDAQMKRRQEMEKQLAAYENMVKSNSESVKPYLPQYNKAIADLKAQLGQQPQTTTETQPKSQVALTPPAVSPIQPVSPTTTTTAPTTTATTGTQNIVPAFATNYGQTPPKEYEYPMAGGTRNTANPVSTAKMNTTNDRAFDYKLENGKYYFKGKPNTSYGTKYPDWKETTADALKNVKFT